MSYEMNRVAAFVNFMELKLWNNVTPVFLKLGILFLVFFSLEKNASKHYNMKKGQ